MNYHVNPVLQESPRELICHIICDTSSPLLHAMSGTGRIPDSVSGRAASFSASVAVITMAPAPSPKRTQVFRSDQSTQRDKPDKSLFQELSRQKNGSRGSSIYEPAFGRVSHIKIHRAQVLLRSGAVRANHNCRFERARASAVAGVTMG